MISPTTSRGGIFCCRLPYYTRRSAAGRVVGSGLDRSAGRQKNCIPALLRVYGHGRAMLAPTSVFWQFRGGVKTSPYRAKGKIRIKGNVPGRDKSRPLRTRGKAAITAKLRAGRLAAHNERSQFASKLARAVVCPAGANIVRSTLTTPQCPAPTPLYAFHS